MHTSGICIDGIFPVSATCQGRQDNSTAVPSSMRHSRNSSCVLALHISSHSCDLPDAADRVGGASISSNCRSTNATIKTPKNFSRTSINGSSISSHRSNMPQLSNHNRLTCQCAATVLRFPSILTMPTRTQHKLVDSTPRTLTKAVPRAQWRHRQQKLKTEVRQRPASQSLPIRA